MPKIKKEAITEALKNIAEYVHHYEPPTLEELKKEYLKLMLEKGLITMEEYVKLTTEENGNARKV